MGWAGDPTPKPSRCTILPIVSASNLVGSKTIRLRSAPRYSAAPSIFGTRDSLVKSSTT